MTRKTEIEVEIDDAGEVRFNVKGIKGKGCLEFVEVFKRVLGQVTDQQTTSEYYQNEEHVADQVKGKVKG